MSNLPFDRCEPFNDPVLRDPANHDVASTFALSALPAAFLALAFCRSYKALIRVMNGRSVFMCVRSKGGSASIASLGFTSLFVRVGCKRGIEATQGGSVGNPFCVKVDYRKITCFGVPLLLTHTATR